MTWLGAWVGKLAGAWFGADEILPAGVLRCGINSSSTLSGTISSVASAPVTLDTSAVFCGNSVINAGLTTNAPTTLIGGFYRNVSKLWRHRTIPVNISAKLQGKSVISAALGRMTTAQAQISAGGHFTATMSVNIRVVPLPDIIVNGDSTPQTVNVAGCVTDRLYCEASSTFNGYSSFSAALGTSTSIIADDTHIVNDEEMAMILLLAA